MLAGMTDAIDYTTPGTLTGLGNVSPLALEPIPVPASFSASSSRSDVTRCHGSPRAIRRAPCAAV